MVEEIVAIENNEARDLVVFPSRRNIVGSDHMFRKNLIVE